MKKLLHAAATFGLALTVVSVTPPSAPAGATERTASAAAASGPRASIWKTSARAKRTAPAPAGNTRTEVPFGPTSGRPFASTSAWNTPVPTSPQLDPRSASIVSYLSSGSHPAVADLYEYGVPIWDADGSTPRHEVECVRPWGTCGLETTSVPVPAGAFATDAADDGAMVVVDWSTRKAYEFYEGQKTSTGWQAGWGGVVDIDGDGTDGVAVGSNVSRLAGVIRAREIAAGRIDHALVFSTDNACTRVFRYPAQKTDGRSTRSDCIPEGARVFLDKGVDVNALPGITPGEKAVARALQTYGAYAIDNGGAKMAFIFEVPSGEADPYKAAGLTGDYFGMDRIPWSRLKVTRAWNGR